MKHVVTLHPHVAGERVADGVVAYVAHVQRARGIRQHLKDVVLLARRGGRLGAIQIGIGGPALGPLQFYGLWVVALPMPVAGNLSADRGRGWIRRSCF